MSTNPNPSFDRESLLRRLRQDVPTPTSADRWLILPTVEEMHDASPDTAEAFKRMHDALWDHMMELRNRITLLPVVEACKLGILTLLFRDRRVTIGRCWESVVVVHGSHVLSAFEEAMAQIMESGVVAKED